MNSDYEFTTPLSAYGSEYTSYTAVKDSKGHTVCSMKVGANDYTLCQMFAASPEMLALLKAFCKREEENATWDKCGSLYYDAKRIIEKIGK